MMADVLVATATRTRCATPPGPVVPVADGDVPGGWVLTVRATEVPDDAGARRRQWAITPRQPRTRPTPVHATQTSRRGPATTRASRSVSSTG